MTSNRLAFLLLILINSVSSFAQGQLAIGSAGIEDFYRRQQLIGEYDSTVSFLIRPISNNNFKSNNPYLLGNSTKEKNKLILLPLISQSKYANKQPYGWNDGSLLPVGGYQQLISAGVTGKFGPLNIQLNPEFHYAQNLDYDGFPLDAGTTLWSTYYRRQLNFIDTPESFGNEPINKLMWGQSSIKLELGPVSAGWSNQNIYWGPGKKNALVMSNNSTGFQHLTLNTNKAIKTPIGHFEAQVIAGKLEGSGYDPPRANMVVNSEFIYRPRSKDWRYLSGIAMTYQPKWIPRLSLGFTRVVQQYSKTAKENNDYFAAFSNLFRSNDKFNDIVRDQLASVFFRYFWTSTKSEFYFEFSRNDTSIDFRDFFLEPGHAAAYLFGFTKLFPFQQKKNEFIEMELEWTILQQGSGRIIRDASTFYIHSRVRHGYTHKGEILGAGIGPSANAQTINVNWVSGMNKLGIQLERYVHNNDLYIDLFENVRNYRRHWVDISAFVTGSWQFDDLILGGKIGLIKSLNYQYQYYTTPSFQVGFADKYNYTASFDVIYLF
ncbi:capsule assembly protein Wzi [Roseivirga pacifica]|uniref:Capsule assembly protein Wzi n=1 Tax=Roseivirga pacifica TaxID=1267423 RepID=A0A1I0N973_9BACT|nr:capsule assembly Wzi family protein [Roseivirga pacifica]RKQ50978.1 capsule assembly protein Wzi [Roseivirga pacifica]SEV97024.1 Capsule assembly protein Wzi [Roseivirga pacifica]